MQFFEKLARISRKNQSLLCVGLDPDPDLMPRGLSVVEFNRAIIEATADLVCAYKPNIAFYEALGEAGLETLLRTRDFIPTDVPVIIDAKRGDIGNTARAYAKTLFDLYGFDAVTLNPYLGFDSVEPFLKYETRGIFILCRTSNTGAGDFQSLRCETPRGLRFLYEIVADKAREWDILRNIGLVIGATYPEELKNIREQHPRMPFLIPGIGAQGGDLYLTVKHALNPEGGGFIINSSRQILYASSGKDFSEAARKVALRLRDEINRYRAEIQS